jgi:hypothetical protein
MAPCKNPARLFLEYGRAGKWGGAGKGDAFITISSQASYCTSYPEVRGRAPTAAFAALMQVFFGDLAVGQSLHIDLPMKTGDVH